MARLSQQQTSSGHTVMVVDDDGELRGTVARLLRSCGHTVLTAADGEEALQLVAAHDVHLMLLDYFMVGMTGEDVVRELRLRGHELQVVLQTGYASERPPRDMLRDLDIQGYHDKSEGPDKLLVWVDAALKAHRHVRAIMASRDGLNHILQAAPQLHRLQSLDDLLRGILLQLQGILGFSGACVAVLPGSSTGSGLVAVPGAQVFEVRVATGRFEGRAWPDLDTAERNAIIGAAHSGRPARTPLTALPLQAGERNVGVVLVELDPQAAADADLTLLEVFAAQAAVAIQNVQLFELATTDDLTGLMNRRAWTGRLEETLQLGARHGHPTSVMLIDVDHFKSVNDTYGHLAGDALLRALGATLRDHVRATDLAGRYGGEELAVLLPHTEPAGARILAERLRERIAALALDWNGQHVQVTASVGLATDLGGAHSVPTSAALLARADSALYAAKAAGRNRVLEAAGPALSLAGAEG
ncbi:diguanylate cyclase [Deinococcus taeanensis]|uniref:GGDEF domain-containing response regulator n=1 Tax=Deinococcus taeanensis TaxID=2737050 RepID=UPI001CDD1EF3|nr:diguanylate cyclase [Deinococcus taeanensis]UBV41477.1 diguanylate cyclase [Deinococcus taeanensis]